MKEFDPAYDYSKDLRDGDVKIEDSRQFVFLRGLERLAKERGIKSAMCARLEQLGTHGVLCTYRYSFADGGVYDGSADATTKNCDGNFKLYLTAMAESRAKARALRTAFGISMCSVEEKSDMQFKDDPDLGPIEDYQVVSITHLAKSHGLGKADVLALLDIPRNIKSLKELTREEGTEIMFKLNSSKHRKRVTRKK